MKWKVVTVGKPSLTFARDGAAEYLKRLERSGGVEWIAVRDGAPEKVDERLRRASERSVRIALDERGQQLDSDAFAKLVADLETGPHKRAAFIIGGADGHTESFRDDCDRVIALSRLTLQHELALVVLAEQLYRAGAIIRGEPYHR